MGMDLSKPLHFFEMGLSSSVFVTHRISDSAFLLRFSLFLFYLAAMLPTYFEMLTIKLVELIIIFLDYTNIATPCLMRHNVETMVS